MGTMSGKHQEYDFPDTLEKFGYQFNENGELRDTETGGPFQFVIRKDDRTYNQRRYEALGKVVDEKMFELLETECGLRKIEIPFERHESEPASFFFASEDCTTNTDKLLVIIHGSGVVRAGQWSRRLIINNNLEQGSQIPYIKKAKELGYAVVVTNGNYNTVELEDSTRERIRGSSSPEEHMMYVWEEYLSAKCPAKRIDVVAHSYGGVVTVHWLSAFSSAREKVQKIAFTDSVHGFSLKMGGEDIPSWFCQCAINWVSSGEYLGQEVQHHYGDVRYVSAGTFVHEETSWKAFEQIWDFFQSSVGPGDFIKGLQRQDDSDENEDEGKDEEDAKNEAENVQNEEDTAKKKEDLPKKVEETGKEEEEGKSQEEEKEDTMKGKDADEEKEDKAKKEEDAKTESGDPTEEEKNKGGEKEDAGDSMREREGEDKEEETTGKGKEATKRGEDTPEERRTTQEKKGPGGNDGDAEKVSNGEEEEKEDAATEAIKDPRRDAKKEEKDAGDSMKGEDEGKEEETTEKGKEATKRGEDTTQEKKDLGGNDANAKKVGKGEEEEKEDTASEAIKEGEDPGRDAERGEGDSMTEGEDDGKEDERGKKEEK